MANPPKVSHHGIKHTHLHKHTHTRLTEHKHTAHKHCHKTWLWSGTGRTPLLELNLCVCVCARKRSHPWGSNHRVLADHWTRLSVSNYIMIIFSSQRELRVILCSFTQWSSTRSRAEGQGRSDTWSTLSHTSGIDIKFSLDAYTIAPAPSRSLPTHYAQLASATLNYMHLSHVRCLDFRPLRMHSHMNLLPTWGHKVITKPVNGNMPTTDIKTKFGF